jgi:hypothetical protein
VAGYLGVKAVPALAGAPARRPRHDETVFFCFGLPRSGTSALARLLNLPNDVFCGLELLRFPDSLAVPLSWQVLEASLTPGTNELLYRRKADCPVRAIGNKEPFYYLALDALAQANPGARFITIYRDLPFVMASCNARARNPRDGWPRGMIGALAGYMIADLCHCLLHPPAAAELSVFEYESLLFGGDRRGHLERLFATVGARLDDRAFETYAAIQERQRPDGAHPRAPFSEYEARIIDLLETDRLRSIFAGLAGARASDAGTRLAAWFADYVRRAAEIEDPILAALDSETGSDPWEAVRGLMAPFGAPTAATLALGLPVRSAFAEFPELRTGTRLGRAVSLLREEVGPASFAAWDRGEAADRLAAIFAGIEGRLWRAFACAVLLKAANMAEARRAARLIRKTYIRTT